MIETVRSARGGGIARRVGPMRRRPGIRALAVRSGVAAKAENEGLAAGIRCVGPPPARVA